MIKSVAIWMIGLDELIVSVLGIGGIFLCLEDLVGRRYGPRV